MFYVNMNYANDGGELYNTFETSEAKITEIEVPQVIQEALPGVRSAWKITNATPAELVAFLDTSAEDIRSGKINLRSSGILWFQGERDVLLYMEVARQVQQEGTMSVGVVPA